MRVHKFKEWRNNHWKENAPMVTLALDKVEAYSCSQSNYQETSFCNEELRPRTRVYMTGGSRHDLWCTLEEFEAVYLKQFFMEERPGIGIGNTKAVGTYDNPILEEHKQ
jgi:hypothetical protein